jgi:predicted DNA-binding protein YlxM (UPF0122 family)
MTTEIMYKMYCDGMSLAQIGKNFNITRQSVYERFKKKKLQLRSRKFKDFIIVDSLKFTINKNGYYESTTKDRLMLHNYNWEKINGKIPKGYEIHHIDLNKLNNNIENLKLVTPSEHTKIHSILLNGSGMNKKVICIETGEIFQSIEQVAKKHGQYASNVSRYYIDGKRKLDGYTYEKIN